MDACLRFRCWYRVWCGFSHLLPKKMKISERGWHYLIALHVDISHPPASFLNSSQVTRFQLDVEGLDELNVAKFCPRLRSGSPFGESWNSR